MVKRGFVRLRPLLFAACYRRSCQCSCQDHVFADHRQRNRDIAGRVRLAAGEHVRHGGDVFLLPVRLEAVERFRHRDPARSGI